MQIRAESRAVGVWQAAALGLFVLLPFAGDVAAGGTLYYRDIFRVFVPLRQYVLEGLARGELRYWNPLLHEGEPSSMLPLAYPLELLQLLAPSAPGISLLLVLHVSLAAVSCALLAASLGHGRLGALTSGVVYAWGGLFLSTLNLYFYVHTAAWAPLLVWSCLRAVEARGWKRLLPTLLVAATVSTQGLELLLQALLVGVLLARPPGLRAGLRLAVCLLLGFGLCGYVLAPIVAGLQGSVRAEGFAVTRALAFSLHPIALLQTLVANLHSDLRDPLNHAWGRFVDTQNYFQSLYLGPLVVVLAFFGLRTRHGRWLGLLAALGLLVALGRYVRLDVLLELVPALRSVRFPVKAFFMVHLCAALLAGAGIETLVTEATRWRRAAAAWLAVAMLFGLFAWGLLSASEAGLRLTRELVPDYVKADLLVDVAQRIGRDLGQAAILCLAAAAVAAAAATRRLAPLRAASLLALVVAVDLLRTGGGLNRMVPADALAPAPEVRALAEGLRAAGARALVCEIDWFALARVRRIPGYTWSVSAYADALAPAISMAPHLRTVLGKNTTMHVPEDACLSARELLCNDLPSLTGRLASAAATHVIVTHPLDLQGWRLQSALRPARLEPLPLLVYALEQPLPFVELQGPGRAWTDHVVPGHMRLRFEAQESTTLVVHERRTRGWQASLDGAPASLLPDRHLSVAVPAGVHELQLDYQPPGLLAGTAVSCASLALLLASTAWQQRRTAHAPAAGSSRHC